MYLLVLLSAIFYTSIFFIFGCSNKTKQNDNSDIENNKTVEDVDGEGKGSSAEESENIIGMVAVYYVDEQTGNITSQNIEVENEYDIWAALQKLGVLTDDCMLKSLTIDKAKKRLDLDFNSATGDRIRSMGTTGEIEIVGCIVNTYLEAYNGKEIKLTEEEQPFNTSHGADLDGYTGIISF